MLLKIAICDDESGICNNLEEMIMHYQKNSARNFEIEVYFSAEMLYEAMKINSGFDLIFLDIEFKYTSGVDIGKKIRTELNNQTVQIVYISSKEQYAIELFAVRPLNFLIKPLEYQNVIDNIILSIKLNASFCKNFKYKNGSEINTVPLKNIIYFESNNRKISIVTTTGIETFYGKIDEVYERVKIHQFLYIHKSYLVNYAFIKKFGYESFLLTNGTSLPISQQHRKHIRKKILDFDKQGILL